MASHHSPQACRSPREAAVQVVADSPPPGVSQAAAGPSAAVKGFCGLWGTAGGTVAESAPGNAVSAVLGGN